MRQCVTLSFFHTKKRKVKGLLSFLYAILQVIKELSNDIGSAYKGSYRAS
jgi:hypothetical protein